MKIKEFRPRLTIPNAGNVYYNRPKAGCNPCIKGQDSTGKCVSTLDVLPNCVGYAVGRFNEIAGNGKCQLLASVNAEDLLHVAIQQGLRVTTEPYLGGCLVWTVGKVGDGSDGAGHGAICESIEKIKGKTVILTSESGWKHFAFDVRQRMGKNWSQGARYKYAGCIINPYAHCSIPRPETTIRYSEHSEAVAWMQWHLLAKGYNIGAAGIDGNFGPKTRNALGTFQKMNGLTVDHVCGRHTKDALVFGIYQEV